MSYLIGLIIILGLIFTVGIKTDLLGSNMLENIKAKIDTTIFPKSEREIVIDNLNEGIDTLNSSLSSSLNNILKSKDISAKDKAAIQKAVNALKDVKEKAKTAKELTAQDKGIIKTISEKITDLISGESGPEPTSIPPQCKMVCDE
ncbi:MAG: hypothetical protein A3G02_00015 [Candidatus Yanofskybacteria bacterium RIFCSPLOWO2_12_FULL_44_13b]|uniref:Uncharacterized protein n=3 Tax=Parcubacteria group TaxID=1794811 RepID=A0A1F8H010_9BACT|nr:MAG: hypothetical protein A2657_02125 [Candidatus Yanofskybacteria bacterium RIFCSPHIGHO2_01_FULL_44_110b]OGN14098.1 MAG: hypothetical protein A3C01_00675 [Candidatus Yanofskybacteria bacterium RIFCSPHIGHO2_02_FULL_44_36b]OGN19297.1 MAG: hypothetical protein A3F50_03325 [Candidatus Yanofskybacteria bacterium RIFCSPHIGHO2_12_FULL_44_29b]OGN27035.1 MAG: hypothetical protein A3B12_00950 [Candidatus Yanofskybacteria bacterium RIFCSPLOWO2_01_FULL_44_88]OGN30964.1 MAG: hypothetical protein A3I96_0